MHGFASANRARPRWQDDAAPLGHGENKENEHEHDYAGAAEQERTSRVAKDLPLVRQSVSLPSQVILAISSRPKARSVVVWSSDREHRSRRAFVVWGLEHGHDVVRAEVSSRCP